MKKNQTMELPVMPLRGLVLFPNMVLHFDVGRKKSLAALEQSGFFWSARKKMKQRIPDGTTCAGSARWRKSAR